MSSLKGYQFTDSLLVALNSFLIGFPKEEIFVNDVTVPLDIEVLELNITHKKNYMIFTRDIMSPFSQRTVFGCFVCGRRFKLKSSRQKMCGDCLIILRCDICSNAFIGKSSTARRRCPDHYRTRAK